jgi:energy-converting hydrogenase Eha subunit B
MIGAARFDSGTYEEVEADLTANGQAVAVVIISSVGAAIGTGATDPRGVLGMLAAAILSWLVWVVLTLFIGTRLLPGNATKSDFGEVLRTTGFSASVGILRIFGRLPVIGWPIFVIVTIWMLLTFVVAIRQALDYNSTPRALAVCLLGWFIHGILFFGFVRSVI